MTFLDRPMRSGDRSFVATAAVAAIASLPLAAGNLLAMLAAVHFDLRGMTDPLVLLRAGPASAGLWRWAMVLDILGYYLPIVPLTLFLRSSLRWRAPSWVDLFALSLLAYCLIGAVGGAELATAVPTLMREYATNPGHRQALEITFNGFSDGIYRGMWNLLEEFLAGVAWVGFGALLRTSDRRLGLTTIVLGAACLLDAFGTALDVDALASVGLTVYLVLAPLWACWLGLRLLRWRADADPVTSHPPFPAAAHTDSQSMAGIPQGIRPT